MIRGRVKLVSKNEHAITRWDWALEIYHSLLKWKTEEFDKKVEQAMSDQLVKVKLSTNIVSLYKIMNKKEQIKTDILQKVTKREAALQIFSTQKSVMNGIRDLYLN